MEYHVSELVAAAFVSAVCVGANGRHQEIRLYSPGTVLGTDCPRTVAYINGLWRTMQVEKRLCDAKSLVRRRSLGNVPEPSDSVYLEFES